LEEIEVLSYFHRNRWIVWLMVASLLATNSPVQLALAADHSERLGFHPLRLLADITGRTKKANHPAKRPSQAELTKPIHRALAFPSNPSDLDILNARVFAEPLVPMDDKSSSSENRALASSLLALKNKSDPEDISDLVGFLNAYPKSRWRPALEVNLGQLRLETGYLSEALKYWSSAWESSKTQATPGRKAVADQAISNLVLLEAQLGLMSSLEAHLSEIGQRIFTGSIEWKVKNARNGLWAMQHSPQTAFKCGPFAVNTLLFLNSKTMGRSETIKKAASTAKGTNLAQLEDWSKQVGLKLQMARRSPGSKIIVPAVAHWKVGHFCAITGEHQGRYRIQDPTFGDQGNIWISAKAINGETDGYCLVPKGPLPSGWEAVTRQEGQNVWGKGVATGQDGSKTPPTTPNTCPACSLCPPCDCSSGSGGAAMGMARASAFTMNATLNIVDYPVGYSPPIGPSMMFGVNYNYNEGNQPTTFTFTNLGPDWSINWVSYLTVDGSQNVTVRVRGGGYEIYNFVSSAYSPNLNSQAQIINLGGGSYQRLLPDGSTENFTLSDGTNIYMTSVADPQGNAATIAYDANFRVTGVTDASSNPATTFTYVSNTLGNPGFYKIASITDGFGRSASFAYDSSTTFLTSITDAVGNVSKFNYDPSSSFINLMTTPYGSERFFQYTPQGGAPTYPPVGLRFTFSDGSSAVIENWLGEQKESYYWDREATALYPMDPANLNYSHCVSTRFLLEAATNMESPVINWKRRALEAPTVYSYPGETYQDVVGTSNKPTEIDKQLTGFRYTATIGGTVTPGDVLGIQVADNLLPFNHEVVHYTVKSGDSLSSIAAGLSSAINSDFSLQAFGISATSSANVVKINSQSINATSYFPGSVGSPTETITIGFGPNPAEIAYLSGTVTAGNVLTITVHDSGLSGGQEAVSYSVKSTDTLITIVQALAIAIGADTNLQALGVTADWRGVPGSSPFISIQSNSPNSTTYTSSTSSGASVIIGLNVSSNGILQTMAYQRNSIGNITQSIDQCGRELQYSYASNEIDLLNIQCPASPSNFVIGQWQYSDPSAPHRPTLYIDGSGQQTQYTYTALAELATITDANSNTTTRSYDSNGYLTQVQGPLSGSQDITTYSFYPYGPLHTLTNSEGYTLSYFYDNLNRLTNVAYPDGTSEQTIYDRLDAVLRSDRLGRWTQDAYDSLDQLSYETDPLGRKTKYCWCFCGSLAALTDPANNTTTWHHDLQGRVIQKVYPDASTVNYVYEACTNRVTSKTDALSQTTNYLYNFDDTLQQKYYSNAVNATSPVATAYDTVFARTASVTNGWGQIINSFNPYFTSGTPITGGGRLASVSNDVIPNSTTTYLYDVLGRTTNRSINSSSNSTTWSYDPMSRITSEVNPLGTFGYNYVNDVPGSSKGDLRLSSVDYPNGQVTNFSYYSNTGDERLQQISNLNPSSAMMSQFNYSYNSAGEITLWQQQQNGNSEFHNLQYDLAGQLTADKAGSGSAQPPFSKEFLYSYDCASNRKSVQTSSMQTARIGGTPTVGDTLTITVNDQGLAGGTESVNYSIQSGDTLGSIAANLAAALTADSNLLALGVNAVSSRASVYITSTSANITTYSSTGSAGATETVTFGIFKNGNINIVVGGTKTTGDVLTIKVLDTALSGGSEPVSYTATSGDTLTSIASALASAINGDGSLATLGVTATSFGAVVNIASASTNATNYSTSLSTGATETLNISPNLNCNETAAIGGSTTTGDTLTLTFYDASLSGGSETVSYTAIRTDTLTSIASGLTAAINADANLQSIGVGAVSSGVDITLTSNSINLTTYRQSVSSGATETINLFFAVNGTQTATIGGSATTGDVVTLIAYDPGLSGGMESVGYTVATRDTLASIAAGLASAVNADTNLSAIGISANPVGTVVNLTSTSMNNTTYSESTSAGATETITVNNTTGVTQAAFNNLNELIGTSGGGEVRFAGTTANPVKTVVINVTQAVTIGGSIAPGDVLWISVQDAGLSQAENVNYVVVRGDTTTSIASNLTAAINSDSTLSGLGVSATSTGPVITIASSSVNPTRYRVATSSGATETIGLGSSCSSKASIKPSIRFRGNASVAMGSNTTSVTAASGGGTANTNMYSVTIGNTASKTLMYDLNGNMTSDGTNSYQWDAENRLIQINYPGTGNYSQFSYDGLDRCVKIVETSGGTITSTKQFIWCVDAMCEARDVSGTLVSQYFAAGQTIAGSNYYYSIEDHPGSIREFTDSTGAVRAVYKYDPYGRATKIQGNLDSDFRYAGYYYHSGSGLNLTLRRFYSSSLGRWISRDPIEEVGGVNLYAYVDNCPIDRNDLLGTQANSRERKCPPGPRPRQRPGESNGDFARRLNDWSIRYENWYNDTPDRDRSRFGVTPPGQGTPSQPGNPNPNPSVPDPRTGNPSPTPDPRFGNPTPNPNPTPATPDPRFGNPNQPGGGNPHGGPQYGRGLY
jgi:RHS repeat-associated protein